MHPTPQPHVPHGHVPEWLAGLQPPISKDEALEYARAHGAPEAALEFLEDLPAAVFTSERGIHHALSMLDPQHLARLGHLRPTAPSHDGEAG